MFNLPIDVVPGTNPPIFKWRLTIDTVAGPVTSDQEGPLPASVEKSVVLLIQIAKQLIAENEELRNRLEPKLSQTPIKQQVKAGK